MVDSALTFIGTIFSVRALIDSDLPKVPKSTVEIIQMKKETHLF